MTTDTADATDADDPGMCFILSEATSIHNCLGLASARSLQPVLNQGRNIVHINYNNVNVFVCQGQPLLSRDKT